MIHANASLATKDGFANHGTTQKYVSHIWLMALGVTHCAKRTWKRQDMSECRSGTLHTFIRKDVG